jgi:hypothetical protein
LRPWSGQARTAARWRFGLRLVTIRAPGPLRTGSRQIGQTSGRGG